MEDDWRPKLTDKEAALFVMQQFRQDVQILANTANSYLDGWRREEADERLIHAMERVQMAWKRAEQAKKFLGH